MTKFNVCYNMSTDPDNPGVYYFKVKYLTDCRRVYFFDRISDFRINSEFVVRDGQSIEVKVHYYTIHFKDSKHYIVVEIPEDDPEKVFFLVYSKK